MTKAVTRRMETRPRLTGRSLDAFEGRPGADDPCGEGLLDTLFDRAPAIDHAADREGAR